METSRRGKELAFLLGHPKPWSAEPATERGQVEPVAATIIRWNLYIAAIAFRLKSSAVLCGSTIGSPSAFEMSRICWRNAVSSFPMRLFAAGVSNSDPSTPSRFEGNEVGWSTPLEGSIL